MVLSCVGAFPAVSFPVSHSSAPLLREVVSSYTCPSNSRTINQIVKSPLARLSRHLVASAAATRAPPPAHC